MIPVHHPLRPAFALCCLLLLGASIVVRGQQNSVFASFAQTGKEPVSINVLVG